MVLRKFRITYSSSWSIWQRRNLAEFQQKAHSSDPGEREKVTQEAITGIAKAVMAVSRSFGESIPDKGSVHVQYDDSIIQDTAAEKEQDMREVGVTMAAWEYRAKWYGEDEKTARARAAEIGVASGSDR